MKSGIKTCRITVSGGNYQHGWIEIGSWSAGFYAKSATITGILWGPGMFLSPDDYTGNEDKQCSELELSRCKYDLKELKKCIKDSINVNPTPRYNAALYNCFHWMDETMEKCKEKSKLKCAQGGEFSFN